MDAAPSQVAQGIIGYAGSLGREGGWYRRNEALIWIRNRYGKYGSHHIRATVQEFQRELNMLVEEGFILLKPQEMRKQWMILNWQVYDEMKLRDDAQRKFQRQLRKLPPEKRSNAVLAFWLRGFEEKGRLAWEQYKKEYEAKPQAEKDAIEKRVQEVNQFEIDSRNPNHPAYEFSKKYFNDDDDFTDDVDDDEFWERLTAPHETPKPR